MPDWSIKIIASTRPDGPAQFVPDIDGAMPGAPLKVETDDLVSWNNTTDQEHWPWPVASQDGPVVDPPPGDNYLTTASVKPNSSSPAYNIGAASGTTIFYCCKLHPAERGQMVVVAFGQ